MFALFSLFGSPAVETPVRATLNDGQVLMGEVKTRVLQLATGAGLLDVPLADIGEVVPVSAEGLGVSEGLVNVWLRNGSELRGRWSDPKLAMAIAVGGDDVPIDLPMNELGRFQLQGGAAWPTTPVFRMRTSWGDDFLVDPAKTHLVVSNQLGTFSPLLAECQSAQPVGDPTGPWRIVLTTGTVLLGKLQDAAVTVALPLGPEEMTVPLENFVSLRLESWRPVAAAAPVQPPYPAGPAVGPREYATRDDQAAAEAVVVESAERRAVGRPAVGRPAKSSGHASGGMAAPASAPAPADGAWFDRSALDAAKDAEE